MAAPHCGHRRPAHGTPRACVTVVPHWGQTHVPLGPAAKGPRMRPRPGPPTPRPRPLPPAPPPRPKPGPCRNGPVPSPRGMTSPLHTWSVAAMARARGRTRPQGPTRLPPSAPAPHLCVTAFGGSRPAEGGERPCKGPHCRLSLALTSERVQLSAFLGLAALEFFKPPLDGVQLGLHGAHLLLQRLAFDFRRGRPEDVR